VARLRLLFILAILIGLSGSSLPPPTPLAQDAYVWQRQWTPALATAIATTPSGVATWRVLAAQADIGGRLRPVAIDWDTLRRDGRRVVLVVRIDGQLPAWDGDALRDDLAALLARWRDQPIAGIEIDHDCGTARLAAYAEFLTRLRTTMPAALRLSITALPAWLPAPVLDDVLAAVDEAVLQVHAVSNPRAGLIDPARALRWAAQFDRRTAKPFRVALPTYGSRVVWDDDGAILAVESERPRLVAGAAAAELVAAPQDMAALRGALAAARLHHLVGIAWFRLPTDTDRRAWSAATWRAVIDDAPLTPHVTVIAGASDRPGLRDLRLVNDGDVDTMLPRAVALPTACRLADGIGAYRLAQADTGPVLERIDAGRLPARHALPIGWMRCDVDTGEPHVAP
jgi:hypothetical protein